MNVKKMGKIFPALCLSLLLTAVFAGRSQAAGTPAGAIAYIYGKPYVVLINFNSSYTANQIDLSTNLAIALATRYSTSTMTAQIFTYQQLAQMGWTDADALHAALVPLTGNFYYFYVTATKVSNAESGTNLRLDIKFYTGGKTTGTYIGTFEISEPLVAAFFG